MTFPLVPSPLGGIIGAYTASFFKLDPTGTVPREPLLDLVPGVSPLRVTFDIVDSESFSYTYAKTNNAVQTLTEITSHVRKNLERVTITGTLGALLPLTPGPVPTFAVTAPQPPAPGSLLRLDQLRIRNLKAIADAKEPIMVVTPRAGIARGIITNLVPNWTPDHGESATCSVTVEEVRLVSPILGRGEVDFPSQTPGNNATQGGGQTATKPANGASSVQGSSGASDVLSPSWGSAP